MGSSGRGAGADNGSHPRVTELSTLALLLVFSAAGAVIGLQLVTTLGVTPNTSIIGVLLAIAASRLPLPGFGRFRSVHRQNLVQTNISSATFGAANSLLVPVGVPVLIGRPDLLVPMLLGATCGMFIDLAMLYWFFDSRLFPGRAPWPVGIAAAEAIIAGDAGGKRSQVLGLGALAGVLGSSEIFGLLQPVLASGLPMAALGLAFLGNVWALSMFAVGLLIRAYAPVAGVLDLDRYLVPHGVMIGAGLVALAQAVLFVARRQRGTPERSGNDRAGPGEAGGADDEIAAFTRTDGDVRRGLLGGLGLYVIAALLLAAAGGLWSDMSPLQLGGWILFAAAACVAAEFIVGFSAMHAGWFPAFATSLIFLIVGLALGFPVAACALLVGFVASGGPAFADAGYDLKAGWLLRGRGRDPQLERAGRGQQVLAAAVGLLVALVVVALVRNSYFGQDLFPPVVRVYAATIESGIDSGRAASLLIWALPGAIIQLAGGPRRQLGVLLGTGLLIHNPAAGWLVLGGIAVRLIATRGRPRPGLTIIGAGLVAGAALWAFGSSLAKL